MLKVHPAYRAFFGAVGVIDLNDANIKPKFAQFLIAKHTRKMPAFIAKLAFLKEHHLPKIGFGYLKVRQNQLQKIDRFAAS